MESWLKSTNDLILLGNPRCFRSVKTVARDPDDEFGEDFCLKVSNKDRGRICLCLSLDLHNSSKQKFTEVEIRPWTHGSRYAVRSPEIPTIHPSRPNSGPLIAKVEAEPLQFWSFTNDGFTYSVGRLSQSNQWDICDLDSLFE